MSDLRKYVNDVLNDTRIFSAEDIIAMDQEEGRYYQKAIEEQYGKIGFPSNKELANSSDVVYVHEYTREDGTVVRAHYRSRAGQANPDKPVMKSPKEYTNRLEKIIDEYMTRDSAARYGLKNSNNNLSDLPETDKLAESVGQRFESSANRVLTGGVDNKSESTATPKSLIRELEKFAKQSENSAIVDARNKKAENIKDDIINFGKSMLNELLYRGMTTEPVYKWQKKVIKAPIWRQLPEDKYPNAVKYYRIASTGGLIEDDTDKDNVMFSVDKIQNSDLKNHILTTMKSNGVNGDTIVVQPKAGSSLVNALKASPTVKNALRNHANDKIINLDFTNADDKIINLGFTSANGKIINLDFIREKDLYYTLGHTHIYKPHKDREGNVIVNIVDYYDFADPDTQTYKTAIAGNAYRQQEEGDLTNYVLLIELKYTPEEWREINNR